ncbi:MAG: hypothetical protein HWN66_02595 [Candidatus Helarchaeota archaeon]|nr:hypothetical protein [Candidatus Helarchaeota archaeon]
MKKRIILLFLIFLSLFYITPISNANPIPLEPIHSGILTPLNETSIYLKSEYISATISDSVVERTEYILKNSEELSVNLSIALPFGIWELFGYNLPDNILLTINGIEKEYNWSIFNYTDETGYNISCSAIVFNLTFGPFEEKIIVATYTRSFSASYGLRFYLYLTETGQFWNCSIEYARFNYKLDLIKGKISISGLDSYSSSIDGHYLVINKEFYNWTPTQNIVISFDLGSPPSIPDIFVLLIAIDFILIMILLIYKFIYKKELVQ